MQQTKETRTKLNPNEELDSVHLRTAKRSLHYRIG